MGHKTLPKVSASHALGVNRSLGRRMRRSDLVQSNRMTDRTNIRLVQPGSAAAGAVYRVISLPDGSPADEFVQAAARNGMRICDAMRLAIEYELVLRDVCALGLDGEGARYALTRVARRARPSRPLGPESARYVRELRIGRTVREVASGSFSLVLPDRLACRLDGAVPLAIFDAAIVETMIAWELAATMDGRTMGEWALSVLAVSRTAS